MAKFDYYLGKVLESLMLVFLVITVVVTFMQVLFRYVINQPLAWSQEVVLISFVYTVLAGAVVCLKNNDHLQVDLFSDQPSVLKKISDVLQFVIIFVFLAVIIYYGYQLFINTLESGTRIGILPYQTAYVYVALPITGILMLYFHVRKVIQWFG